jgi:hypothetical protein
LDIVGSFLSEESVATIVALVPPGPHQRDFVLVAETTHPRRGELRRGAREHEREQHRGAAQCGLGPMSFEKAITVISTISAMPKVEKRS